MDPEDQRTSCPGFLDEHGVWNNGFECPPINDKIRICCGSESRRYCCTLESSHSSSSNPLNRLAKNSYPTPEPSLYMTDTKSATILTLPILLTCILVLIIIFSVILLCLFCWYRHRSRLDKSKRQENLTTKSNLLVDHFPFSPPHHQFFINENNSPYHHNKTSLLHHQAKDTLTTTTLAPSTATSTSSASGRIPSDIYFNDWKDFLIAGEQPMNMYPTMSSHSNELGSDHQYHHSNYFYHGKRQEHDVIV